MNLHNAPNVLAAFAVSIFGVNAASAATIRVPADQPTVQGAINIAVDSDVVLVAPGTYFENIDFSGKAITVESEQGSAVTTLDGGNVNTVVIFSMAEGRDAILRGFTITNGKGFEGGGIGIFSASPTIEGNLVTGNVACEGAGIALAFASPLIQGNEISGNNIGGCIGGFGGGGISIRGPSTPEIVGNLIANNVAGDGAGITMFAAGNPIIRENEIRGNQTSGQGGAIYMVNQSDALIEQNLIYDNSANEGGGIYWSVPKGAPGPRLVFNTIAGNTAMQGAGINANGFDAQAELIDNIVIGPTGQAAVFCGSTNDIQPPVFSFNDIFAPGGQSYAGICTDQTGVNGNISADPLFGDPANGDFRLSATSPAIDAAIDQPSVTTDFLSNARPADGDGDTVAAPDLGVFEAYLPIALAGVDATVDGNTTVALDASASSDLDGVIASYDWVQTVGPAVTLTNAQSAMPTFVAPGVAANLTFQVTVTDDLGFTDAAEVAITVNQPPPPPPAPPPPPGGSGGGGCTLGPADGSIDPSLPLLVLICFVYLLGRRYREC